MGEVYQSQSLPSYDMNQTNRLMSVQPCLRLSWIKGRELRDIQTSTFRRYINGSCKVKSNLRDCLGLHDGAHSVHLCRDSGERLAVKRTE